MKKEKWNTTIPTDCPFCDRELDSSADEHHLIPKSKKGKDTVRIHKVCHRFIHANFSEKELARTYNTIEALRSTEVVQNFIKWLQNKPIDFYIPSDNKKRK